MLDSCLDGNGFGVASVCSVRPSVAKVKCSALVHPQWMASLSRHQDLGLANGAGQNVANLSGVGGVAGEHRQYLTTRGVIRKDELASLDEGVGRVSFDESVLVGVDLLNERCGGILSEESLFSKWKGSILEFWLALKVIRPPYSQVEICSRSRRRQRAGLKSRQRRMNKQRRRSGCCTD